MRTFRSYHLVPALLALSLVLTAATPLVRSSCGMTHDEMATKPCCKNEPKPHDASAMPMHDGPMAHGDTHDATMPCHETPEPSAPCPDGPAMHDACCFTADAPTAPTPERLQLSPSGLLALAAAFVLPPQPADAHGPPSSGSPPAAPVALHLLYGSFLT